MSRANLNQLRQLGLDSNAINGVSNADKQAALDAASDTITGILATQFPPPILTPYPMDLIKCECIYASWELLMTQGYNPASGKDDNITQRYKWWVKWLEDVSIGEIVPAIISASAAAIDAGASGPAVITSTQRGYSERGIAPFAPPAIITDPFSSD